jgi:glutamyl-tRNA synthetase
LDNASYLYAARPLSLDTKAASLLEGDGRQRIGAVLPRLEELSGWSAEIVEHAVRAFADETGIKLGQIAQPLRAALTGRATSPGLFDVMTVLGRDESIGRLKDQAAAA